MLKMNDVQSVVNGAVYDYIDKTRIRGINSPDSLCYVFLALYSVKVKGRKDSITHELEEVINIRTKKDDALYRKLYNTLKEVDYDDYLKIYTSSVDKFVELFFAKNRFYSFYSRPESLTSLMCELLRRKGVESVYNPFAGYASVSLELGNVNCYSQEMDYIFHAIGMVLLDAHGLNPDSFCLQNPLDTWNPSGAECVVSIPPFALSDPNFDAVPVRSFEDYVFWQFSRSCEKYAVFVVPSGFCYNSSKATSDIRKTIVDNNYLEMVISLPSGLFSNTGIATSLVVLNKERKDDASVAFIDARNLFVQVNKKEKALDVDAILELVATPERDNCVLVSQDKISHNDNNWSIGLYLSTSIESVPEGYQAIDLCEIIEPISLKRKYAETRGHLAMISQLSQDVVEYMVGPDQFKLSDDLKNAPKLEEPALLLSTIGVLKPTFCPASAEAPVYVHQNVRAFRIKASWVNPAYLCLELSKFKDLAVGVTIPHINMRQLLRMQIAFPSLNTPQSYEEQGRLFGEFVNSSKLAKAKELGLQEVIDKMKSDYILEVRNRKHDMKTPMTQLRNTLTLLDAFATSLPEELSTKLKGYINRQRVAVDTLSEIVRHLADEEVFSAPEVLNIDSVLSSFVENNEHYSISYKADEAAFREMGKEKPLMKIGKADLLRLVNNIIGNAIVHGFADKSVHYDLVISLTVEDGFYVIDFSNNGIPMPEGMDKTRYGMRGVKGKDSKGLGTGGYVVKNITEHYGGDYDVFTRNVGDDIFTDVIIKLPIYQDYE